MTRTSIASPPSFFVNLGHVEAITQVSMSMVQLPLEQMNKSGSHGFLVVNQSQQNQEDIFAPATSSDPTSRASSHKTSYKPHIDFYPFPNATFPKSKLEDWEESPETGR